jgi:SOS response regulatory protein OraA/RecX
MNSPQKSVAELMAELESLGVTKEQVDAHLQKADNERARELAHEALSQENPLDAISVKLDKLQESVDALAAKLDR